MSAKIIDLKKHIEKVRLENKKQILKELAEVAKRIPWIPERNKEPPEGS